MKKKEKKNLELSSNTNASSVQRGPLDDEALSSRFHGSLKRFSTVFSPVFRSWPPSNAILTRHKLGHIVLPDAWRLVPLNKGRSVPLNAT